MDYNFESTLNFAKELDKKDILSHFRNRFFIPENTIYMDGNSLGLMSKDSEESIKRVIKEWQNLAIRGWLEADTPWFYLPEKIGKMSAELFGAEPDEIIPTGTTTHNIYSVLSTFYNPNGKRKKILADNITFPSDIYALKSFLKLKGMNEKQDLILVESNDNRTLCEDSICRLMTDDIALVFLPSVLYRSGQLLDLSYLTKKAHEKGIIIGFDCCHSAGAIPHSFSKDNIDFAVWCSYKYMNSGPGSSAFIYVNKKHFEKIPGITGWFGYKKDKQFEMSYEFEHEKNAGGWQVSTPSILSIAPIEGAVNIFLEAGINNIREKSKVLTSYLVYLINLLNYEKYGYNIGTPIDPEKRSSHIALEHKEAWRICEALKNKNIIPDFRMPNIIRIAPVSLYNTFEEVWYVANELKRIIDNKDYLNFSKNVKSVS